MSEMHRKAEDAPALVYSNLSLCYKQKQLFSNLSFSIPASKCTCLLGPSGSGKSTLLRLATGDASIPFSGDITFSTQKPSIGWMSQDDLLLPWMSLLDNIILGAKLRGEADQTVRTAARDLLQQAGLSGYEKELPGTLSGGMKQRGALLRTLMEDSELLLMDEPFSSLDALTRFKLQNLSAHMTRGKTVLLVTHDPMEALRMGEKILVLSGQPATIQSFESLPGSPPRKPGNPEMNRYYTKILELLETEEP